MIASDEVCEKLRIASAIDAELIRDGFCRSHVSFWPK